MQSPELSVLAVVLGISLAAEYVDSTLGMGYGTSLTAVLLMLGLEPLQIIPAVLVSQLACGIAAGICHHRAGNADFHPGRDWREAGGSWRERVARMPRDLRIGLVIAGAGLAGAVVAPLVAIRLPAGVLKLYVAVLVVAIGLGLLLARRRSWRFSWRKVALIGFVASLNKGMTGGGYGPVVSGGQLLTGVGGRNAIAITALAEGFTCLVALVTYRLAGLQFDWRLALAMAGGALVSVPLSVLTVRRLDPPRLRHLVGVVTLMLGVFSLVRLAW